MTHHDDLDRELVTWFSEDAARRMPAGLLGAIQAKSKGRRQQPGWLVALRGGSMGVGLGDSARTRRLVLVVAVAAIVALLAIIVAGQQQRNPLRTGLLAFVRNGDVYLAEPDGSNARVALHLDGFALSTVAWSPDDASLAIDGESGVVVLDSSTGNPRFVGGSNPVWSPDGQELAVLDPYSGNGEQTVRIVDAASLSTRAVFPFPAIGGLAWSPNGRWIAATGGESARSVVRIDLRSGEVIQIEGPSGHLDSPREISWSTDSLRVAFVRYGNSEGPRCSDFLLCRVDVVVANADGTDAVQVNLAPGQADMPSWSPDGKWLAYRVTDAGSGERPSTGVGLQILPAGGTGERSLVTASVRGLAWGRDSMSLLYAVGTGASEATIWGTSLSGEARRLDVSIDDGSTPFERTGLGFAWQVLAVGASMPPLPNPVLTTPAATLEVATPGPAAPADPTAAWPTLIGQGEEGCAVMRIATASGLATKAADLCNPQANESSTGSISPSGDAYALIRDGRLSVLPTNGLVGLDVAALAGLGSVEWSPDGMWLTATGAASYLLRPDGSGLHEIPGTPAWSPDGHTMAVATADGALLIGRSDGTGLTAIGMFPAPVTWAPDGSRFGFGRNGDLWTAAIDGSDVRNVTSFPFGGASVAAWSPDGAWIVVTAGHGLWLMGPDGTPRRRLDLGLDESIFEVVWSPDSRRVAVQAYDESTAAGQTPLIYLVNADGSSTIRIDGATGPSWSPDGRFLVAIGAIASNGGWNAGSLTVMNPDGSGRHDLGTTGLLGPLVWVRQ